MQTPALLTLDNEEKQKKSVPFWIKGNKPKPKPSVFSKQKVRNSKLYSQSYSTSILPRRGSAREPAHPMDSLNRIMKKNEQLDPHAETGCQANYMDLSVKTCQNNTQAQDIEQSIKMHRTSILDKLLFPSFKNNSVKKVAHELRQTTDGRISPLKMKNKVFSCLEKTSVSGTNINITKVLSTPVGSPRFLNQRRGSQKVNAIKGVLQEQNKKYLRQTLDVNFAHNDKNNNNRKSPILLPFHYPTSKTGVESGKKWFSNRKIVDQALKSEKQKKNVSSGTFWKNRVISSPSKSPQPQNSSGKQTKVHSLHNQTTKPQIPKFLLQKHQNSKTPPPPSFTLRKSLQLSQTHCTLFCTQNRTNTIFCIKKCKKSEPIHNVLAFGANWKEISHPNIVQIYAMFNDQKYLYIIQQYIDNGSLEQYIKFNIQESFSEEKIVDKIYDVTSGLNYLHKLGYSHGPLTKSNILVSFTTCKLQYANSLKNDPNNENAIQKDMWYLGLLIYEIFSGHVLSLPEQKINETENQQKKEIQHSHEQTQLFINNEIQKLQNATQILKEYLKKLLCLDHSKRITSSQMLNSNLFQMYGLSSQNQKIQKDKESFVINKNKLSLYDCHQDQCQSLEEENHKSNGGSRGEIHHPKPPNPPTPLKTSEQKTQNRTKSKNRRKSKQNGQGKIHWTQKLHRL